MKMEKSMAVSLVIVAIVTLVLRLANWLWFRPKKLERYLKRQGVLGNPYRVLYGDLKDSSQWSQKARSKPLPNFSHDVSLRVAPFLRHLVCSYGKNSVMWVGPVPRVTVMKPEQIKDIFMNINDFHKVKTNPLFQLLAPGLASLEEHEWAKHRKIINPAFHQEKLKLMLPQMYESCNAMIENWKQQMCDNKSCEIDVFPDLQNLSCDVISRCAFGSNFEEGKIIFDLLKELAEIIMQMAQSLYIPGSRFLPTKTNRRMKQIDREIKASLETIIKKREKAMRTGEATKNDLLGILMESNKREIEENKKTSGLSIEDVMDECRLFYFAGQETTSVLLVWTMILLSMYPTWQTSARQEVLQVFGGSKPSFEGLNHLKIVSMILNEVLRLYPPAIMLGRATSRETRLGNVVLPKGAEVALPIVLIHHDKEIWGDDALEFKPERFSGGVSKAAKYQGAFLPFGLGPRICVGQNFALVEAKMALALILQNFSFELSPSYSHAPYSVATLRPQHGAPLILHKL